MAPGHVEQSAPPALPPDSSAPGTPSRDAAWPAGLDQFGLGSLAAPLAAMVRPVAWLGAQALLVLQPTLSLFGAGPALTRLIQQLETWDSSEESAP